MVGLWLPDPSLRVAATRPAPPWRVAPVFGRRAFAARPLCGGTVDWQERVGLACDAVIPWKRLACCPLPLPAALIVWPPQVSGSVKRSRKRHLRQICDRSYYGSAYFQVGSTCKRCSKLLFLFWRAHMAKKRLFLGSLCQALRLATDVLLPFLAFSGGSSCSISRLRYTALMPRCCKVGVLWHLQLLLRWLVL